MSVNAIAENMFKKKTLIVSNHYYMSKNELIVYKRLTIIILKKCLSNARNIPENVKFTADLGR